MKPKRESLRPYSSRRVRTRSPRYRSRTCVRVKWSASLSCRKYSRVLVFEWYEWVIHLIWVILSRWMTRESDGISKEYSTLEHYVRFVIRNQNFRYTSYRCNFICNTLTSRSCNENADISSDVGRSRDRRQRTLIQRVVVVLYSWMWCEFLNSLGKKNYLRTSAMTRLDAYRLVEAKSLFASLVRIIMMISHWVFLVDSV